MMRRGIALFATAMGCSVAMVNVSATDAVGGSWFIVIQSGDNFAAGPVLRWRRWLGPTQSLDVALGTRIISRESFDAGSVLGLLKYSPVSWLGVAARPELSSFRARVAAIDGSRPVPDERW